MKTVKTQKGTELPLLNLKGKDYLQVAHRIQWFTEEEKLFTINTEFLVLNDDQTVCRATIMTFDNDRKVVRQAVATKRETKKDFSDHTEKAETGAIGRALVELGYGTQFALADLDEGLRLADSPLVDAKQRTVPVVKTEETASPDALVIPVQTPSTSSFSSQRGKAKPAAGAKWV